MSIYISICLASQSLACHASFFITRGSQQAGSEKRSLRSIHRRHSKCIPVLRSSSPQKRHYPSSCAITACEEDIYRLNGSTTATQQQRLQKVDEGQSLDRLHFLVAHVDHEGLLGLRRRPLEALFLCYTCSGRGDGNGIHVRTSHDDSNPLPHNEQLHRKYRNKKKLRDL